jgi:hypothetical protein
LRVIPQEALSLRIHDTNSKKTVYGIASALVFFKADSLPLLLECYVKAVLVKKGFLYVTFFSEIIFYFWAESMA